MSREITVAGIEETCAELTKLPKNVVARAFLRALQAAAKPMELELAVRTPVGQISAEVENRLSESQVTEINLDSQLRGGTVDIGFGKQGHIALWVEYGHRLVGHKPGEKVLGSVPARPFMRPAADASADAAIEAFATSIQESVDNDG